MGTGGQRDGVLRLEKALLEGEMIVGAVHAYETRWGNVTIPESRLQHKMRHVIFLQYTSWSCYSI